MNHDLITKKLAAFTAHMTYDVLSPQAIAIAKQCILDWLGVSIRGSQEPPAQMIRTVILKSDYPEASLLDGSGKMTSALDAAFANGAASHTLDFDDLHNPSIIHLATVVVPAALAAAEKEHKSGANLIAAVCAGYEAGARAGESIIPESYFFWHTTGTAGIFGSAAAAANVLGLDEKQTLMCYGSAGTQAAGLWEFLKEGSMSKCLHAGKAAYGGLLSAYLSREGFTAASQILEGEKGFCSALSAKPHLNKLTDGMTYEDLKIQHNSFKPYPCCKHSHAAIWASLEMKKIHHLMPEDIAQVAIKVNEITDCLINNSVPLNPYGCKFSIQYCVAAALCDGKVDLDTFTNSRIHDKKIRELMEKVHVMRDADQEKRHQNDPDKLASGLVITTKDGRHLSLQADYAKGDPENPMTWEEAKIKFMSLALPVYGQDRTEKLYAFIEYLEQCPDVAETLSEILRSPSSL